MDKMLPVDEDFAALYEGAEARLIRDDFETTVLTHVLVEIGIPLSAPRSKVIVQKRDSDPWQVCFVSFGSTIDVADAFQLVEELTAAVVRARDLNDFEALL